MTQSLWNKFLLERYVDNNKRIKKTIVVVGGSTEAQLTVIKSIDKTVEVVNQLPIGYGYVADFNESLALEFYTLHKDLNYDNYKTKLVDIVSKCDVDDLLILPIIDDYSHSILEILKFLQFLHSCVVLNSFNSRIRDSFSDAVSLYMSSEINVVLPLEKGECDFPLGVNIMMLLYPQGNVSNFNYIQQILRFLVLKHGGSLLMFPPHDADILSDCIHDFLKIPKERSTKLEPNLSNNYLFIPRGWDTWGKIKVLRDLNLAEISPRYEAIFNNGDAETFLKKINIVSNDIRSPEKDVKNESKYTFDDLLAELHAKQIEREADEPKQPEFDLATPMKNKHMISNSASSTPSSSSFMNDDPRIQALRRFRELRLEEDMEEQDQDTQNNEDSSFGDTTQTPPSKLTSIMYNNNEGRESMYKASSPKIGLGGGKPPVLTNFLADLLKNGNED